MDREDPVACNRHLSCYGMILGCKARLFRAERGLNFRNRIRSKLDDAPYQSK